MSKLNSISPFAENIIMLPVYLVRSTKKEERYGEVYLVAAKNEDEAYQLTEGKFDYNDKAEHCEKTEMFAEGKPRIIKHIYLD